MVSSGARGRGTVAPLTLQVRDCTYRLSENEVHADLIEGGLIL